MKKTTILFLLFLLLPLSAWADYLGCKEPSATVSGGRVQFPGTATSVSAVVLDANDAVASPYATPTMTDRGGDSWTAADFSVPGSPTYGTHTIRYIGTVNGQELRGTDTFEVSAACPLKPTVAGRQVDITAANKVQGVVLTDKVTDLEDNSINNAALASDVELNGKPTCDITAASSNVSFTVSCTDSDGNAITLAADKWVGTIWRAYTNGGSPCNSIDEKIRISAITSGGVITAQNDSQFKPFTVTPNTSNCGIVNP